MSQALIDEGTNNAVVGYSVGDFFSATQYPAGAVNLYTVMSEDSGTDTTKSLEAYNLNSIDKTCDIRNIPAANYFKLTLTDLMDVPLPDTSPVDGIVELPADGTAQCKLLIEKYSGIGNPLTGSSHTNSLTVWAEGAKAVDNYSPVLVNGVATVIISAPGTLGITDITVKDLSTEALADATTQLQFK